MSGVIDLGGNIEILQGPGGTPPPLGTVTQVNTGAGLTGGPITTTGTISVASISLTNQAVGVLPVVNGGTGTSSQFSQGSVIFADGSGSYAQDNANLFWDDTNNRLGICTATPTKSLEVWGSEIASFNSPSNAGLIITQAGANDVVIRGKKALTDLTTPTAVTAGTRLLRIQGQGYNGSSYANGGEMHIVAAETFSGSGSGTYIVFQTTLIGAVSTSERMRITDAGNVGINTTTPTNKLEVSGTAAFSGNVGVGTVTPAHALDVVGDGIYLNGTNILGSGSFSNIVTYSAGAYEFSCNSTVAQALTRFLGAANTNVATTDIAGYVVPTSGSINNLFVVADASSFNGGSTTFTVMKNQVATSLSASINTNGLTASTTGTSVSFAAGDTLSLRITTTGSSSGTISRPRASVNFSTTTQVFSSQWVASSSAIAYTGGNVGIGTNDPTSQLHTTGSVRFANFGAGAATFDANGNISSVSDEDLKDVQGVHSKGLSDLINITPIEYKWRKETGFDTENVYVGFSAQNVQSSLGEKAIGKARTQLKEDQTPDTIENESPKQYLSIQDRAIMAAMINAIKELAKRVSDLEGG